MQKFAAFNNLKSGNFSIHWKSSRVSNSHNKLNSVKAGSINHIDSAK